jgi:hypothetical protein
MKLQVYTWWGVWPVGYLSAGAWGGRERREIPSCKVSLELGQGERSRKRRGDRRSINVRHVGCHLNRVLRGASLLSPAERPAAIN